jgi:hypothetical protein
LNPQCIESFALTLYIKLAFINLLGHKPVELKYTFKTTDNTYFKISLLCLHKISKTGVCVVIKVTITHSHRRSKFFSRKVCPDRSVPDRKKLRSSIPRTMRPPNYAAHGYCVPRRRRPLPMCPDPEPHPGTCQEPN